MNKQHKWQMNRAGLLNFWYYDDEVFDFADGKLLLRGSNGSGKSVTMQSILPILLDGKKSPDRLDPFRSRARKMEDYLLGEKEVVDREERTGYLFLEYKRADTDQYMTTGIGLQARRNKKLSFWGFVITDNRRIGEDLLLYEHESHAGEKQKIPLSRIQLENRIAEGGHVVQGQGEYMKLVNKYIFGFETLEAYEDLIELLIQLRSPKLSKDFRPTVIYDILEAALPPLTDEDLRHLSDTIEHMDQTKQQIEQLEREQVALDKITQRYDAYNKFKLVEAADYYLGAKQQYRKSEKDHEEKLAEKDRLNDTIDKMEQRDAVLERDNDILEKKQARLRQHKVWDLEEEKATEQSNLKEISSEEQKKDQVVTMKTKQEVRAKERLDTYTATLAELEASLADQLIDLEADASEASFDKHFLNVEDFERNKREVFDFTIWKKEAENHYELLDHISEDLRSYEQLKAQMAETEKQIAETQMQMDQTIREAKDWEQIFEKDKQGKMAEIYQWEEQHASLEVDPTILQQTSRVLDALYEPNTFDQLKAPFIENSQTYQMKQKEQIAASQSEKRQLEETIAEQEALLNEWKNKKDPEPDTMLEETKLARVSLQEAGYAFIPFYESVEFQDHVKEATRLRLEAVLMDSGLLNALITEKGTPVKHDRILQANPHMMAHTLADYLTPDIDPEMPVSGAEIDDVLRSVLVETDDSDETMVIRADGTYQIGLLHGHAVPVDTVRFIGRNARKRYREEQIEWMTKELERLAEVKTELEKTIQTLGENAAWAQRAIDQFPDDADLETSFREIQAKRFEMKQLEKEIVRQDETLRETMREFHELKRQLDAAANGLDITFSYRAYQDAKKIQYRYDKALNELEKSSISLQHTLNSQTETAERLTELETEVDELKGELNLLMDKKKRLEENIATIEHQLQEQGMADIRQQIQDVQQQIRETQEEHAGILRELPKSEAQKETLTLEINAQEQKLQFQHVMITAWEVLFDNEKFHGFIQLPEGDKMEQSAWVVKTYQSSQKDISKIEEQLTKTFYEQLPNLMEYRMTDHSTPIPDLGLASTNWTEDQVVLFNNWKAKASRRLIQLDFQGKKLNPYSVAQIIEEDRTRQQTLLNDHDRQLYEEILFDSVGKKLRSRINRAKEWTKQMNQLMVNSDSTSGITFSIQWKPRTAETEAELDTKQLVELLQRDPRLLKEEDLNEVMDHFRSKINRAKEMIDIEGEGNTLLQVLKEVLDYRYWFSFVLSYQRVGETKRELTNNAFYKFSGGEKAMAMYIPLFTACYSRYLEADPTAPYIISLDEAFAGVDDENISVMFRLVEDLGFDYMMNSQMLWGDYDTVSSLAIYELVRPKNADYVSVIPYIWDGNRRHRVDETAAAVEEDKTYISHEGDLYANPTR